MDEKGGRSCAIRLCNCLQVTESKHRSELKAAVRVGAREWSAFAVLLETLQGRLHGEASEQVSFLKCKGERKR